jgi:hypothetical protein
MLRCVELYPAKRRVRFECICSLNGAAILEGKAVFLPYFNSERPPISKAYQLYGASGNSSDEHDRPPLLPRTHDVIFQKGHLALPRPVNRAFHHSEVASDQVISRNLVVFAIVDSNVRIIIGDKLSSVFQCPLKGGHCLDATGSVPRATS